MDKYFTLLDNRPEEANPEDPASVNQVGLAICPAHQARLAELGLDSRSEDGVDGGMIAAIVIGVTLLALVAYCIYRRRKAYEQETFATGDQAAYDQVENAD
jgi:hypothetical protein